MVIPQLPPEPYTIAGPAATSDRAGSDVDNAQPDGQSFDSVYRTVRQRSDADIDHQHAAEPSSTAERPDDAQEPGAAKVDRVRAGRMADNAPGPDSDAHVRGESDDVDTRIDPKHDDLERMALRKPNESRDRTRAQRREDKSAAVASSGANSPAVLASIQPGQPIPLLIPTGSPPDLRAGPTAYNALVPKSGQAVHSGGPAGSSERVTMDPRITQTGGPGVVPDSSHVGRESIAAADASDVVSVAESTATAQSPGDRPVPVDRGGSAESPTGTRLDGIARLQLTPETRSGAPRNEAYTDPTPIEDFGVGKAAAGAHDLPVVLELAARTDSVSTHADMSGRAGAPPVAAQPSNVTAVLSSARPGTAWSGADTRDEGHKGESRDSNKETAGRGPLLDATAARTTIGVEPAASRAEAAPTAALQTADRNQLVQQLSRHVESLRHAGDRSEMSLALAPEHLGGLRLTVATDGAGITARIVVDSAHAHQMIDGAREQLRSALENRGLSLTSLDVTLASSGDAGGTAEQQRRSSQEAATAQLWRAARQGAKEVPAAVVAAAPAVGTGYPRRLDYAA